MDKCRYVAESLHCSPETTTTLLISYLCTRAKSLQSCLTLCDPVDRSLPGSSVHEILQARILSGLPCPPPGFLPDPGIETASPATPALQVDSLPLSHQGGPNRLYPNTKLKVKKKNATVDPSGWPKLKTTVYASSNPQQSFPPGIPVLCFSSVSNIHNSLSPVSAAFFSISTDLSLISPHLLEWQICEGRIKVYAIFVSQKAQHWAQPRTAQVLFGYAHCGRGSPGALPGLPMTVSWAMRDFAAPASVWALQKYSPAWSRRRFLSTSLLSCL